MSTKTSTTKTSTSTKREKRVFKDSSQVAHVWAQQSQNYGCNPTRNIYFEGTTIFSYGSHFILARFSSPRVVLINDNSYSVTTSGQQRDVENALHGLDVEKIYVNQPSERGSAKDNLRQLWQSLHTMATAHKQARSQDFRGSMIRKLKNLAAYAKHVKLGRTKELAALVADCEENPQFWAPLAKVSAEFAKTTDDKKRDYENRLEERRTAKEAREKARRERATALNTALRPSAIAAQRAGAEFFIIPADVAETFSDCLSDTDKTRGLSVDTFLASAIATAKRVRESELSETFGALAVAAWRAGNDRFSIPADVAETFSDCLTHEEKTNGIPVYRYTNWNYDQPTLLRVNGDLIETSRGASVPLAAAKRAWPALLSHSVPPQRIGNFEATKFADGILTIGCHRIGIAEMQRIASELGLEGTLSA